MTYFLRGLLVALPWLWISGAFVSDIARGLTLVVLGIAIWAAKESRGLSNKPSPQKGLYPFAGFLGFYVVVLFLFHSSQLDHAKTGVDFAIFTQVVHNWKVLGLPVSTLIGIEPQNFLTHHFVPILVVPKWFMSLGLDAGSAVIVFHCGCFLLLMASFFCFCRTMKISLWLSSVLTALLACNPTIRHALFFEVHDEIFALPFIALAWWMWRKQHWPLMLLGLLLACLTKESMFAMTAGFGLMTWCESQFGDGDKKTPRGVSLVIMIFGVLGFITYVFLQPLLLRKSFDHASKLASFAELLKPEWLAAKLLFTAFLFLPFLGIPLLRKKYLYLLFPVLPLIGLVWLSKFPEMWKWMNYYGAAPSLLLGLATVEICQREFWLERHSTPIYLALTMTLAFSFSERRPTREIYADRSVAIPREQELGIIPSYARVVASPAVIPHLLRVANIRRLNSGSVTPDEIDFIVTLPSESADVPEMLKMTSKVCLADPWLVYCRGSSMR